MYRKWSAILFPVACLALVFSLQWGTNKQHQMGKMKVEAENQYQRSFHDFVYQVGKLDDLLGRSEAIDGKSMLFQRSNAVQLARLSSEAQNNYHQLPVSLLPDTHADDFFTAVYQFAHQLATSEASNRSWTADNQQTLHKLHLASAAIAKRMHHLQQVAIASHLKWTDAESAYAQDGKIRTANTLYANFHQLNTILGASRTGISGPQLMGQQATPFIGPTKTKQQIRQIALTTLNFGSPLQNIRMQTSPKSAPFARYTLQAKTKDGVPVSASFSKQGGHLLWMKQERVVGKAAFSEQEAVDAAVEQLNDLGFASLIPISEDRYDGVVTVLLALKKGDVIHYPHRVVVQVGLDQGDLLGVQVSQSYYAAVKDIPLNAKLTVQQAKLHLAPGFNIRQVSKVTLLNEQGKEVLGYAFYGQKNKHNYTVFLDANTGEELHIDTQM